MTTRRFELMRDEDESGVSGTGRVAEGTLYSSGWVTLAWTTRFSSVGVYRGMEEMQKIHGHGGKTRVVWIDP